MNLLHASIKFIPYKSLVYLQLSVPQEGRTLVISPMCITRVAARRSAYARVSPNCTTKPKRLSSGSWACSCVRRLTRSLVLLSPRVTPTGDFTSVPRCIRKNLAISLMHDTKGLRSSPSGCFTSSTPWEEGFTSDRTP